MPGQARRRAAVDRDDVDVGVAVVLRAEGDRLAVGGEGRVRLDADVAGQPAQVRAVEAATQRSSA